MIFFYKYPHIIDITIKHISLFINIYEELSCIHEEFN